MQIFALTRAKNARKKCIFRIGQGKRLKNADPQQKNNSFLVTFFCRGSPCRNGFLNLFCFQGQSIKEHLHIMHLLVPVTRKHGLKQVNNFVITWFRKSNY